MRYEDDPFDGDGLDESDMAALFGVPKADVHACLASQHRAGEGGIEDVRFPPSWWERAYSRGEIFAEATGGGSMAEAVAFWKAQEGSQG